MALTGAGAPPRRVLLACDHLTRYAHPLPPASLARSFRYEYCQTKNSAGACCSSNQLDSVPSILGRSYATVHRGDLRENLSTSVRSEGIPFPAPLISTTRKNRRAEKTCHDPRRDGRAHGDDRERRLRRLRALSALLLRPIANHHPMVPAAGARHSRAGAAEGI